MNKRITLNILYIVLILIVLFFSVSIGVGYYLSAPGYSGEKSEHFNGKRFLNPSGKEARGFGDLIKWMRNREREAWIKEENAYIGKAPDASPDPEKLIITFVNHSTFLIQYKGLNVLSDPIWSDRTSPFQWAGPQRMRPPGIRFEDLPTIDLILISHNHYDHLDVNTMKALQKAYNPMVICPLGVSKFIRGLGFEHCSELDWWQETKFEKLNITCVPAQHFSGRGMFDRDATLWAGYVLNDEKKKIYFAGDTGYDENMFREIGSRFDSIDVSMIPIGAFKPRWFMSPIHVGPEEAIMIHNDVRSKKSIAMHFGTFPLADDGQKEPENLLQKLTGASKEASNPFLLLKEGMSAEF